MVETNDREKRVKQQGCRDLPLLSVPSVILQQQAPGSSNSSL